MAINLVTVPDLGTDFELDTSNQKINVNIDGTTLVRKEDGTLSANSNSAGIMYVRSVDVQPDSGDTGITVTPEMVGKTVIWDG
ncbi:hypothetical protein V757_11150 [Pelistega indica]|uniref:Uncharacterized protein n=1 Tax=Pelistega indica TaxID=1414851 RepID=V8FV12_9BURK|nr:hypothetical protein [Pelistega indica]ETD67538.1 hypothetical protein V757_11150 [Pelistega indica]